MSLPIHVSQLFANALFLGLVVGIPLTGYLRKVDIYHSFISGAKQGLWTIVRVIPHFVAMLVAIGMLRASGAFDTLSAWLSPWLSPLGVPTEILPQALLRPFSGSGTNAMMADLMHTYGGDSYLAYLAGTISGSTETTFYVLAIYFGAVNIQRARHAVFAGLLADLAAIIASLVICRLLY